MAARAAAQATAVQRVFAARRVPQPASAAAPRAPLARTRRAAAPHVAQRNPQLPCRAVAARAHAVAEAPRKPRGRPRRTAAAPTRRALPRWAALPALGGFLLTWGLGRLASPPAASADLGEASGALGSMFSALVVTGVLAGLALSAAPLLGPPPPPPGRGKRSSKSSAADKEADAADAEVTWTLAGVVALIPFTNWVAWLGLALDIDTDEAGTADSAAADASRRVRYLAFAALYALPYLHSGLSVDALDVVAVLACAAHVQLERIAVTEPRTRLLGGGDEGGEGSLDEWARTLRDVADAAAAAGGQKSQEAPPGKQRGRRKAASAAAADVAEAAQAAPPAAAALARAAGARVAALTAALAALRDEFEEARPFISFASLAVFVSSR